MRVGSSVTTTSLSVMHTATPQNIFYICISLSYQVQEGKVGFVEECICWILVASVAMVSLNKRKDTTSATSSLDLLTQQIFTEMGT